MKHSLHSTFTPERRMMYYLFLLGFFAIFSTTISKNPVLPLFSECNRRRQHRDRPHCGVLPARRDPVLVSRRGSSRTISGENASSSLQGAVFLIAPVLYLFITEPVWLIPVRFFHGTGNRDPRAGHLRSDRRTVPGHERPRCSGSTRRQRSSAGPLRRSPAGSSSRICPVPGAHPVPGWSISPQALCRRAGLIMTLLYKEEKSLP